MTSYMEIPEDGVYSKQPRAFAGIRRNLRSYRYCLGATSITVIAITVIAVASILLGGSGRDSSEGPRTRTINTIVLRNSTPEVESLTTLLSLEWPRRDCHWYNHRWNKSMNHNETFVKVASNGTRPIKEIAKILKANPIQPVITTNITTNVTRKRRQSYRELAQFRTTPVPMKMQTLEPIKHIEDNNTMADDEKSDCKDKPCNSDCKDKPCNSGCKDGPCKNCTKCQNCSGDCRNKRNPDDNRNPEETIENADNWLEDWKAEQEEINSNSDSDFDMNEGSIEWVKDISMELGDRHNIRDNYDPEEEYYEDDDTPDGERWTKDDGSSFPEGDHFHWNRRPGKLPRCSSSDMDKILAECYEHHKGLELLEKNLAKQNLTLKRGTASHYHQQGFRKTSPRAKKMGKQGRIMEWASKLIKKKLNLSKEEATFDSRWVNNLHGSPYCEVEGEYNGRRHHCDPDEPYRSADGSCNNLKHPSWGKSFTEFRRLLPPDYGDGISVPRLSSENDWLPSARIVSTKVHVDTYAESQSYTMLTMSWGQFIDHDITATAASKGFNGQSITCCNSTVVQHDKFRHPDCFAIHVPRNDPFFSKHNVTCMEFTRSASSARCHLGPRQQINQLTAFLDGSVIYGSTQEEQNELRFHKDGFLKSQVTIDGQELLMANYDKKDSCNTQSEMRYDRYCFKSGDSRVNEHILLTILHNLFVRQHNAFALTLQELNSHWNDEKLFQESRKIVIALMQHITYHEYLPSILGPVLSKSLKLSPNFEEHFEGYRDDVNPGIANEFAASAFRFGHSMIQGLIQKVDKPGKTVQFEQTKKYYFNPFTLYDMGTLSSFVRGEVSSMSHAVDTLFTSQVTNRLFQPKTAQHGLDLVAINIQRGRDHGIAGYTRWRMACGLSPVKSFDDLEIYMNKGALKKIKNTYKDVHDIDLYTGGLAEKHLPDALVGPTFGCIIADQFLRLKIGDRFWYENKEPQQFTRAQLNEIQKGSLARLICDNAEDVGSIQRWPLRKFATGNPRLACSAKSIPRVDLGPWEEGEI